MAKRITLRLNVILPILVFTLISNSVSSQEQNHEIGIRLSGINEFDFIYKKQKKPNKYIRYRLISTDIRFRKIEDGNRISFATGLAIGKEKRNKISDRLSFIHGLEPSLYFSLNKTDEETQTNYRPSIGYVLGFQYQIKTFYVNVEAIPALSANYRSGVEGFDLNAGFNTNGVALTIAYQFKCTKE